MSYTNFQVGEKFPLPISTPGEGGLFQYDINGLMFILKLNKTDIIAVEAFRTGKMELALFAENDILFFLYKIDGIFKDDWGDCPYSVKFQKAAMRPDFNKPQEAEIHLYLVDNRLDVLLAMRTIKLNDEFQTKLRTATQEQLDKPFSKDEYMTSVQNVWRKYTSAQMREKAIAVQDVAFALPTKTPPLH
jgi:hypothetical protein